MSFTVPPSAGKVTPQEEPSAPLPEAPVYRLDDFRTALDPLPPVDGDEVWAEVLAAARLFGVLRDAGLSVRFDVDDPSSPPRVRITDLEGRTVREVSASIACDPAALEAEVLGQQR